MLVEKNTALPASTSTALAHLFEAIDVASPLCHVHYELCQRLLCYASLCLKLCIRQTHSLDNNTLRSKTVYQCALECHAAACGNRRAAVAGCRCPVESMRRCCTPTHLPAVTLEMTDRCCSCCSVWLAIVLCWVYVGVGSQHTTAVAAVSLSDLCWLGAAQPPPPPQGWVDTLVLLTCPWLCPWLWEQQQGTAHSDRGGEPGAGCVAVFYRVFYRRVNGREWRRMQARREPLLQKSSVNDRVSKLLPGTWARW